MTPARSALTRLADRLRSEERGVVTVLMLFLVIAFISIGALAVDVTHLYAARAQLQVAADSAAHAALFRRNQGDDPATARQAAISVATFGMPLSEFGTVLAEADVTVQRWDATRKAMVADENGLDAVTVVVRRTSGSANPVPTFMFRMVGIRQMDVAAAAIYVADEDPCLNEGLIAAVEVDIRSRSEFRNGFCLHSNGHVEVNNGNLFEQPGVVVSMPDLADFVMPASGFRQNEGLEQALRRGSYDIPLLDLLEVAPSTGRTALETAMLRPNDPLRPSWITSAIESTLAPTVDVTPASLTPGRIHRATCSGSQTLTFKPARRGPTVYSRFVLITNCAINFDGRVDLEDAVILTTNDGARSIQSNSGGGSAFNVGRADSCGAGGGARIFTRGGVKSSATMTVNGGQIVAAGEVEFSAQAGGLGASIISGSRISGTSNLEFTGCRQNLDWDLTVRRFRLAG